MTRRGILTAFAAVAIVAGVVGLTTWLTGGSGEPCSAPSTAAGLVGLRPAQTPSATPSVAPKETPTTPTPSAVGASQRVPVAVAVAGPVTVTSTAPPATVTVPGPRQTVPGPTVTVTVAAPVPPRATVTVTATPTTTPSATVTPTPTPSATPEVPAPPTPDEPPTTPPVHPRPTPPPRGEDDAPADDTPRARVAGTMAAAEVAAHGWRLPRKPLCVQSLPGWHAEVVAAAAAYDAAPDVAITARADCGAFPSDARIVLREYVSAEDACAKTAVGRMWSSGVVGEESTIWINTAPDLRDSCSATSGHRAHLVAHEIGHAFGLAHRDGVSVMASWEYTAPTSADLCAIHRLYGSAVKRSAR